jgi:RNA 2',3'-cyclic 3'-phosphodiesterase
VPNTARVFFGLPVDAPLADTLATLAQEAAAASGGRAMPKANLHATVAFIGSVQRASLAALSSIGENLRADAMDVSLDTLGSFRSARVAWIGPSKVPQSLRDLHASLGAGVVAASYDLDPRPYNPHVTLARHCRHALTRRSIAPLAWHVDRLVLYESISAEGGPRYEPLATWRFTRRP